MPQSSVCCTCKTMGRSKCNSLLWFIAGLWTSPSPLPLDPTSWGLSSLPSLCCQMNLQFMQSQSVSSSKTISIASEDILVGWQKHCTEACKIWIQVSAANQAGEETRTSACIPGKDSLPAYSWIMASSQLHPSESVLFWVRQRQKRPLKHNRQGRTCILSLSFKHKRIEFHNWAFKKTLKNTQLFNFELYL